MSWLKKAYHQPIINLDKQIIWPDHMPKWTPKIEEKNRLKNELRKKAEIICKDNGHILFPWTCMNSTLCRKCGKTVYLHNVHGQTDGPDMEGAALVNKCNVNFDGDYEFSNFEHQDYNGMTII